VSNQNHVLGSLSGLRLQGDVDRFGHHGSGGGML
jgi:hypothetical protein